MQVAGFEPINTLQYGITQVVNHSELAAYSQSAATAGEGIPARARLELSENNSFSFTRG